jgi:5'-3' exonuclease
MFVNLIVDGNYLLSKNTFTLHKNNLLYGALLQSLENTFLNYRRLYPFNKIYLVSDTRGKSWRKDLYSDYKGTRKKDSDIDWEFVYNTYEEFKSIISKKGVKVLESPGLEGDDFIAYLSNQTNLIGQSNFIISNDHDIKQLIKFQLDPNWMNIMCNEMWNQQKLFIPKNYQIFLSRLKNNEDDIFQLTDDPEFVRLINQLLKSYQVQEVDPLQTLLVKVISGDTSDNILSVYRQTKNGKVRGIGDKGAESIINSYESEFGELSIDDPDLWENLADLIIEKKKGSNSDIPSILERIKENLQLVDLRTNRFPLHIQDKLKEICGI